MKQEDVTINIRNMASAQLTGVQRYTQELLRWLRPGPRTLAPPQSSGGLQGHFWEQVILPRKLGQTLLFSPANTGPLAVRRQVVTIHDVATLDHPEWFEGRFAAWYRWLLPRLARRVQHVLTVSEASRARIIHTTGVSPDRVTAIALAADGRFQPVDAAEQQRVRSRLELPERFVLAVGSLEPRKNLAGLFAAWQGWDSRPRDLRLVVVGGAGHVFRNVGFGQLPPDVQFLGRVDDADLPGLYTAAEIFAYPSLYEGFGLPPLEAMACGTPVLTSSISSLPEVVRDAALLADPTQPESIRALLDRLSRDAPLREELRGRGLERAGQFSWQRTAAQTWDILSREAQR